MKTRLACLAAMAVLPALPAAAHAQGSITLYGVVDAGVEFLTNVPNAATGGSNNAVRMSAGNLSTSRWGLRGAEDLGGGLKAVFTLENGFDLDTGSANQGGRLFGRQAFVGLRRTSTARCLWAAIRPCCTTSRWPMTRWPSPRATRC